ncbi:3-hydroxy-3-methylglutaryl-coenzyme A reductase 1 [Solanum tuberosum]|uniref:3-hydroxy-3-methylglutaryl-coenzyme A reductase 1 n=1 Tax=Solanum tuberosum TaxID=4113 RepID=HMDH1_SOLTU|nr:3-hydroxy-3-methylglutaryl-coenzyme A reductase 1 [Solanum tuberosum]P48020.1 RecName: Full=3-hydroxy-3-methylglutaryl-coenzyme A reductase 1; Short=HMG-CoA reductase 1; Short=HMGR; Short=HMGR1 [Solanum tuberosum]AAA93498.1 hydroxymethylglutaryl coenzyme A reductase [Solanum tuberosum]
MDVRRRPVKPLYTSKDASAGEPLKQQEVSSPKASDALPLPLYLTNGLFFTMFFSVMYFLLVRWREKIRNSIPLHVVTLSELLAMVSLIASVIYLLGFFGIGFVQSFVSRSNSDSWDIEDENAEQLIIEEDSRRGPCAAATTLGCVVPPPPVRKIAPMVPQQPAKVALSQTEKPSPIIMPALSEDDEEIIQSVVQGKTPSYSLESKLGDCMRAASIRKEALQRITGKSLEGLPLEGFDYSSILGQCCEMPVGYVQIPVGIAGPLLLDGREYSVPMATTEGCLVASTNRGCKAIFVSGGADSVLLRDGMTRAPVVRFTTAKRAAELKFFVEDPLNFETLSLMFNKSSRFARLQGIQCAIAGKNLYITFSCSTGDAMGMNMVSKGVQNVLDYLQSEYPDMDVIGISGNFCSDKKPAAVNWIEGRGKSVVCEAIIKEEVVKKVLKTEVAALVELNMLKNLTGSAMAGALGGFNAHASNIVSAVYLATGQDPAQNVESSHCITMMEAVNDGKDLHVSVTMPSIEVGTVGGGTQLASQSACLNLLGVKGANRDAPGSNARLLATIVAGSVLAGELSLMSAISAGQLVKSHMKYNRSIKDISK